MFWYGYLILCILLLFLVIFIILLFFKLCKYKNYIFSLLKRMKNYEKIYPLLKNYEFEEKYGFDKLKNKGLVGELFVKRELEIIAKQYDFILFNNLYLLFENRVVQIDHLLILNDCIFVIETKNWSFTTYGNIKNDKWIQYHGNEKKYIFSPIKQNNNHVKTIYSILREKNINLKDITFFNIVVFVNNNLKLKDVKQQYNLINLKALNLLELRFYIENQMLNFSKYFEEIESKRNVISRIILENNNYENIKIHQKQLNY